MVFFSAFTARAAIQFDVFPGFDNMVPEASWFPIVCEVKNDGPSFNGTIEVTGGQFNDSQIRRVVVELPTGTLKRIVIPVFATARYQSSWDVRLLDERGRTRAEQLNQRPRQINIGVTLLGALPRTATGQPVFRDPQSQNTEMKPAAARILTQLLPDNPLVLEGLDSVYLSSEKAADLNDHQVFALLTWLNNGGHLIVGIEQISDVNGVPWLKGIVPCDLADMRTVSSHHDLQDWLRGSTSSNDDSARSRRSRVGRRNPASNYNPFSDLAEDPDFEKADLQVITGRLRNGTALVSAGDVPLIITSHQGRGRVTALMFSAERKPFSAWKNLPSFWSKLAEVSPEIYRTDNPNNNFNFNPYMNGLSIDGVFGAMIDSKQVRKLPVEWLLLLLIVYLVVIGPLDQYWLKRIKRPMLTWVTFPCYVVMFSLLIYFIGYKLRAGETEWNELHLVDVLQNGDGAELRGHTYASIYSPINATYRVESEGRFSAFRGELQSWNAGGQGGERAEILQNGDNYKADIFVPVWTSQLYASDWLQAAPMPVKLNVTSDGSQWSVSVMNLREHALANAHLAIAGRIMDLGDLPSQQTKTFTFTKEQGRSLRDFVGSIAGGFQGAVRSRESAFGATVGGHISDLPNSTIAVSFISDLENERYIMPPGLDLSSVMEHGNAILLAWESGYSPIKPLNQFTASRGHKDTLWRVSVPVTDAP